jgi:SAM-dependent MidA family methyltransferase
VTSLADRLAARIAAHGPIRFDEFHAAALYDPDGGFYATGGQAGRRGDFLTSPEVGPLFGAVVARALDGWWESLGRPAGFTVVDAGAGPGTLARAVLGTRPGCLETG